MKIKINTNDIIYIQAEELYIRIYLQQNREIVYRDNLCLFLSKLPTTHFVQVHRHYIVNTRHIVWWNLRQLYIGAKRIPISKYYAKQVNQVLLSS